MEEILDPATTATVSFGNFAGFASKQKLASARRARRVPNDGGIA